MRKFLDLKIATKLLISFILVSLIAGVVGVIGLVNIIAINNKDTQLYEENTLAIDYLGNAEVYYQRVRFNALRIIADEASKEESLKKIEDYVSEIESYFDKYKSTITTDEDQAMFNELSKQWKDYSVYNDAIMKAIKEGKVDNAKTILLGDAHDTGDLLQEAFDNLYELNSKNAKAKSDSNESQTSQSIFLMIIVIAIGILIAVILGIIIARIISEPIKRVVKAAEELAIGNVNVNLVSNTKDETGKLMQAFNKMIESIREQALATEKIADGDLTVDITVKSEQDLLGKKLAEMVEKNNTIMNNIASASEQVASGAKQISDSSMALSQGATEQASSVEELTSSLEEISSQTELNAQNANQANQLAEVAKSNAIEGNTQMKDMQKAMEDINESSSNISKIIKVIDDIAFQTNILALNAAVEAARAGQHGKGFAVVAEEVRNLAAKSANAAKETTDMIENSIKKVEAGTKLANKTAVALNKIVEDVSRAADLVNDIATASNEQATGIAQINQGIMQVSQVVQTNSATSEETAAASEELSSQADLLSETVKKFKLKKINYSGFDTIDPEVFKMISNLSDKSKNEEKENEINRNAVFEKKQKIILNDNEFGKY